MNDSFSFYIQRYFMSYLMKQHNFGPNTVSSYRDTFKLLLAFLAESDRNISKKPIDEVDYDVVLRFLSWLSDVRKNGVSTKNVRLAHIKSFFRYITPDNAARYSVYHSERKIKSRPTACLRML